MLAVGTYHLSLPSGLVLELNNCYCIPALRKNIMSSSRLEEVDGYDRDGNKEQVLFYLL